VFDHCDPDTRQIIDTAVDESRRLDHNYLGTEHLLFAFARRRDLLPELIAEQLPDADAVRAAFATATGQPPRRDAELLKAVGVDLDEVRSAVRRTFGDDALGRLSRGDHQPWQPWRRPSRRCTSLLARTLSVAPRVKQSLERARNEANRRQLPAIDPTALLLGMLEVEDALSNKLLRHLGVPPEQLRHTLRALAG
jgi:ATP-dependent Clp protease ATP-binding subunit ClpA